MNRRNDEKDFDLTCWYLNLRRVAELTRVGTVEMGALASISDVDEQMRKLGLLSYFKNRITEWIGIARPPSLGELITKNQVKPNIIFTHYSNYYFRGLSKTHQALMNGAAKIPMAAAYSKLDEFGEGLKVQFVFSHEQLTSTSSWVELSGQKRVLVIGLTKNVTQSVIEVVPYVIAYPIVDLFDHASFIGSRWQWHLETFIEQVDAFARVSQFDGPRSRNDLEPLRLVPEEAIKHAFSDIIEEPTIPKDWGGERSR